MNSGGGSSGGRNDGDDDQEEIEEEPTADGKATVIADFDPSALERGAKALREIDASNNSKDVLRLAMETEKTKQKEAALSHAQLQQDNLVRRQQLLQQEYEQKQRMQQANAENMKELKDHEAKLKQQYAQSKMEEKRRTNDEWLAQQKRLFEEQQALEKQTAQEIEQEKRRTMDYQANLDRETAVVRAEAETEGSIRRERENRDITKDLLETRIGEEGKINIELQKEKLLYYASFASGLRELMTSPEKMPYLVGGISAMAFGIYGSRMSMGVLGRFFESRIGKPSLVRETSRVGYADMTPRNIYKRWSQNKAAGANDLMKNIVLEPALENKMNFIGRGTRMTKANDAPFRHVCIYGPPGTGKTLFARSLARTSGMHYAVVSGGDFAPLGANAVTELHKLFDWAESTNKGMILFIDEADAFLRKGRADQATMSENMRNALSAFLFRTGTETSQFQIVLATNVPEALDSAVLDRIDEAVEFPLPGENERKRILQLYFKQYIQQEILDSGKAKVIKTTFNEEDPIFDRLTQQTDGFSGRQLSKYMISVQSTCYSTEGDIKLDQLTMEQILQTHLMARSHGVKL